MGLSARCPARIRTATFQTRLHRCMTQSPTTHQTIRVDDYGPIPRLLTRHSSARCRTDTARPARSILRLRLRWCLVHRSPSRGWAWLPFAAVLSLNRGMNAKNGGRRGRHDETGRVTAATSKGREVSFGVDRERCGKTRTHDIACRIFRNIDPPFLQTRDKRHTKFYITKLEAP